MIEVFSRKKKETFFFQVKIQTESGMMIGWEREEDKESFTKSIRTTKGMKTGKGLNPARV